ncbi:uncharacterized protein LOC110094008 [Dendrobium catenatum]|uniref:uncharacterized protein LOC110094008 n=1 Tax=Dendrobium catenatum TaxID=906689 RepID=UPI0009F2CD39|nr:uncharacterized protein LOC110094008 [Dendrobium catenatum]
MEVESDDDGTEEIYEADVYDEQPVEAEPALEELKDGGQAATMDELKEVNLGTKEDPRPTFISFIHEEKYADWIANIVSVKKKNGQIRVCIDFRDFNKVCPKNDFPLIVSELLVDNTSNYDMFSFMDGSSSYNQIKIAPDDE